MKRLFVSWAICIAMVGCWCVVPAPVDPIHDVLPVTEGVKVLVVEESANRTGLSKGHQSLLVSPDARQFLLGRSIDYRFLDADALTGVWKDIADSSPPKRLPWLYVVSGRRIVHSDFLPADVFNFKETIAQRLEAQ